MDYFPCPLSIKVVDLRSNTFSNPIFHKGFWIYLHYWCAPRDPRDVKRSITSTKQAYNKIQKTVRKQAFPMISVLSVFLSLSHFRSILVQKLNSFTCILIFWHPWDSWWRVNIGMNCFSVHTTTVMKLAILLDYKHQIALPNFRWIKKGKSNGNGLVEIQI